MLLEFACRVCGDAVPPARSDPDPVSPVYRIHWVCPGCRAADEVHESHDPGTLV